jgi:hypothetical protein
VIDRRRSGRDHVCRLDNGQRRRWCRQRATRSRPACLSWSPRAARAAWSSRSTAKGGGKDLADAGAIFAGDLKGAKARLLLMGLLAAADTSSHIAEICGALAP